MPGDKSRSSSRSDSPPAKTAAGRPRRLSRPAPVNAAHCWIEIGCTQKKHVIAPGQVVLNRRPESVHAHSFYTFSIKLIGMIKSGNKSLCAFVKIFSASTPPEADGVTQRSTTRAQERANRFLSNTFRPRHAHSRRSGVAPHIPCFTIASQLLQIASYRIIRHRYSTGSIDVVAIAPQHRTNSANSYYPKSDSIVASKYL